MYKIKEKEDSKLKLKERMVLHGNRYIEKEFLRKDCAAADMMMKILVLALPVILGFETATADIKGPFMQSGPIWREVLVRPPPQLRERGIVWKLTKISYGMVEAGLKWLKTVDYWMGESIDLTDIPQLGQIFTRRHQKNRIYLMVAKPVDEVLVVGHEDVITKCIEDMRKRFDLESVQRGKEISFNGCEIVKEESGAITISMQK